MRDDAGGDTMTTVAVTGASGFVGRQVVRWLRRGNDCRIVACGRNAAALRELGVEYVAEDVGSGRKDFFDLLGRPDRLIHLAWSGLPAYHDPSHVEENLVVSCRFLRNMIASGLRSLTVAGTCYEYGMQTGCLAEDAQPAPTTCYAVAKDALRIFLESLKRWDARHPFQFIWARMFFLYGEGQRPAALIPQVDRALASGREFFDMSGGEQLRDFLRVEEAGRFLAAVAMQDRFEGIVNICSGSPISVRRLVEERIALHGGRMRLNLGVMPYTDYEPMAYWGDAGRLRSILEKSALFLPKHADGNPRGLALAAGGRG